MKFFEAHQTKRLQHFLLILGSLIVAFLLKTWLILSDVIPFNSDEAVVGLMARHILQGADPIFFYGQAYMGSLDAWLVAVGFTIFGEHVWVIRGVQTLLYLGIMGSTYILGRVALGSRRVGLLAMWLMAIPNVIVTLYTTVSLGGYGEGILLGSLNLIVGITIAKKIRAEKYCKAGYWFLWGFLTGFGLWVFGISLVFSIPMGIFMLLCLWDMTSNLGKFLKSRQIWRLSLLIIAGFVFGAIPFWAYAYQNGLGVLFQELVGSAVAVEQTSFVQRSIQHLGSYLLFGSTAIFGMRPSWEVRWLGLPLMPFILIFWIGVFIFTLYRLRRNFSHRFGRAVLFSTMITLGIGFVFTSFGVDPSGRYFLPMVIPLSLFAAEMIDYLSNQYSRWALGLVGLILVYHSWGIYDAASHYPPGITTQFDPIAQVDSRYLDDLILFLEREGETRGYTNYWVSYPLAFLSEEELVFVPRLPYHQDMRYTERDNRYAPYVEVVEAAEQVTYITTHHLELNDRIRGAFIAKEIDWKEHQIGDYLIFYNLSDLIKPEEIDLNSR